MLKVRKVAITGGLSSGKTTVCHFFGELGSYIASADAITHKLLSPETTVGRRVIHLLGSEIISDHTLNRQKIAEIVFSQPKLLRALEEILHPAVFDEIERQYLQVQKERKHPLFIAEVPLLYESERAPHFDAIIAISATEEACRSRSSHSPEAFDRRMARQIEPHKKAAQADYTITNNSNLAQLKEQVQQLFLQLTK